MPSPRSRARANVRRLSPEALARAFRRLRWDTAEAGRRLYTDPRTIRRWLTGRARVPGPAIAALELLGKRKRGRRGTR